MLYSTSLTAPIFGLRREIDRLFEDAFSGRGNDRNSWVPSVNVRESKEELTFDFELPGIKPEQVEITADNGVLTVKGERREERTEGDEDSRYHVIERLYGAFSRSFQLPQGVDEGQIRADFEDGVLRIHVPKAALPQPRRIEVQATRSERSPAQVSSQSRTTETKRGNGSSASGEPKQRGEMAAESRKR